jgi:hypothetical protein
MKIDLVRAPLVIGSVIAGAFVIAALLALTTSSSRWDDHLINAAGIFAGALALTIVLRLGVGVVRPQPGASTRRRFIKALWLLALLLLGAIGVAIALFIDSMSFL